MADKELGITVTGDLSDIQAKLETLTGQINGLSDKTINIDTNVDSNPITQLENELNNVVGDAANVDNAINSISPEAINEASSAASGLGSSFVEAEGEIEAASTGVSGALGDVSGAAADVDSAINSITPEALNEAESAANSLGDSFAGAKAEVDSTSSSMQGMNVDVSTAVTSVAGLSSSFTGLGGQVTGAVNAVTKFADSMGIAASTGELLAVALGAVVAVAVVAFLVEATNAAGDFNDSWSRLANAVGEGGQAIQDVQGEWSDAINTMKDETGRSAGIIRNHIINMGLAGVTSKDLIIQAFEGISGAAFVTGQSIDSIEQAYRRAVSTGMLGSRQLMQIGITTDDVFKATGMTMDQVREKFKNLDADGRAALLNLIINQKYGEAANEAYKNSWQHVNDALTAAWQALSIVVGQLIIPVVIPAIELLTNVLNGLAGFIGMVESGFTNLGNIIGISSITLGGLIAAIATGNPILAGLGVVAGFIADNWGRLSKDWNDFWTMIKAGDWSGALTLLVNELKWAFLDAPLSYLASLPAKVGEMASQFLDIGKNIINWIVSGLTSLSGWLDQQLAIQFGSGGQSAATGMVDGFGKWLDDNGWKIAEIVGDVLFQVLPKLIEIAVKIIIIVLNAIFKHIEKWAKDLPGNMYNWGKDAASSFGRGLWDNVTDVSGNFQKALKYMSEHLPRSPPKRGPLAEVTSKGMYNWVSGVMDGAVSALKSSGLNMDSTLGDIADKFGVNTSDTIAAAAAKLNVNVGQYEGVINQFGVGLNDTVDSALSKLGVGLNTTLNSIVGRLGGSAGVYAGNTTSNTRNNINLNVNLEGANIGSRSEGATIGSAIGQSAASTLAGQALNHGVSVINYLRS